MLSSDRLGKNLRAFCDKTYETNGDKFVGFPATRDEARDKWAAAFDDYLSAIEQDAPPPPSPLAMRPCIALLGVKNKFFSTLQLPPIGVAATAARDFADAWKAAINAITPGIPVIVGTVTYRFTGWSNVPALHDALRATLTALFQAPTSDVVQRLTQIATAFHTATFGLQPTSTGGPIKFQ